MFESLQDIVSICETEGKKFWYVVLQDDVQERHITEKDSLNTMMSTWQAMLAASKNYDASLRSNSGLVGGDGAKMDAYRLKTTDSLCGDFVLRVMTGALQMGESNACMKRIVAAPTAGACGVLPAVLVPYYQLGKCTLEDVIHALYVAAGIGQVIAHRASISGAAGGCQAEIGSASAMAAGALTFLQGGSASQIAHSAAMALKNLLGLVCDPVAGLVEVPCVKRNVIGAVNALSCSDMVMAGIVSKIPPDQVIDAMKEVGDKMDASLRETALGGLSATPFAMDFQEKFKNESQN